VNDAHDRSQDLSTSPLADRIRAQRVPLVDCRRVDDFLNAIAHSGAGAELRALLVAHPNARALADMIAEGSPYLFDLIVAAPARWLDLLRSDPEARLAAIIADIADAANADQATAMRRWRQARA
jgi:[glutamine synthetase] adenylyltransferase / [glutamine synthetase]-adenylyl-L-tyrosine phosphorylase